MNSPEQTLTIEELSHELETLYLRHEIEINLINRLITLVRLKGTAQEAVFPPLPSKEELEDPSRAVSTTRKKPFAIKKMRRCAPTKTGLAPAIRDAIGILDPPWTVQDLKSWIKENRPKIWKSIAKSSISSMVCNLTRNAVLLKMGTKNYFKAYTPGPQLQFWLGIGTSRISEKEKAYQELRATIPALNKPQSDEES